MAVPCHNFEVYVVYVYTIQLHRSFGMDSTRHGCWTDPTPMQDVADLLQGLHCSFELLLLSLQTSRLQARHEQCMLLQLRCGMHRTTCPVSKVLPLRDDAAPVRKQHRNKTRQRLKKQRQQAQAARHVVFTATYFDCRPVRFLALFSSTGPPLTSLFTQRVQIPDM